MSAERCALPPQQGAQSVRTCLGPCGRILKASNQPLNRISLLERLVTPF